MIGFVVLLYIKYFLIDLQIWKRFDDNESDFYFKESQGQNYFKIPFKVSENGKNA